MHWLRQAPIDWTSQSPRKLQDEFVRHYPSWREGYALAERAGMVPGTFPDHGDARTTWQCAMNALANQAKLYQAVEEAACEFGAFKDYLENA
jgi:hypothetical protein